MTKLLKNVLNKSDINFLNYPRGERKLMSEFQNRMCAVSGGAMRDRTADLFSTQNASFAPPAFRFAQGAQASRNMFRVTS